MQPPTSPGAGPAPATGTDEERLAQLGYKQELRRKLSGFSNFAVSFSIISILAGAITSYGIAMTAGGPMAITLGWLFVGIMVIFVALAMAEICSVYPTAGALYWWAAALAKRNKAAWAWFVGWFNFLGEVAVTAAIDFGAAITTSAFLSLTFDMEVTAGRTLVVFLVIIVAHGLLNTFGVNLVRMLSDVSAWWHLVGVAVIVGGAGDRAGPAQADLRGVLRGAERHRLHLRRRRRLRRAHRSADGAVHVHRLRRQRARGRGDPRRGAAPRRAAS